MRVLVVKLSRALVVVVSFFELEKFSSGAENARTGQSGVHRASDSQHTDSCFIRALCFSYLCFLFHSVVSCGYFARFHHLVTTSGSVCV